MSYAFLDVASRRLAKVFSDRGLTRGDAVAILMENCPNYIVASLAAQRAGLYYVPVNWHLSADEATYIVTDSDAKILLTSPAMIDLATSIRAGADGIETLILDGTAEGFETHEVIGTDPPPPVEGEVNGYYMFYSSGTTGRPKGIKPNLPDTPFGTGNPIEVMMGGLFGIGPQSRYLSPGPLYHAAPLGWSLGTISLGGTAVIMEKFDPEATLAAIDTYDITHGQFVPTMFVRMLKLPADVRSRYDISSLQVVIHAAAPCPIDVKEQMIEWFGPIIFEFYAGSEGNCFFMIDSPTWLTHKGSVGKAVIGIPHVLDEDGTELPVGETGQLWFEAPTAFAYHKDDEKTADAYNDRGWSTLGDMGYLDGDGFLYLADRRTDMILSGGVNIYPREIEEALLMNPKVADVAVIGVPNDDFGQEVKAVVQPAADVVADDALTAELMEYLQGRLARYKQPRSIDYTDEVPRLPSGKILRRVVREKYVPTA